MPSNTTPSATKERAYRIGRIAAWCMFAMVPIHFLVPCHASETTMTAVAGLGLLVTGLSIVSKRGQLTVVSYKPANNALEPTPVGPEFRFRG
jgi:hypothetical protein